MPNPVSASPVAKKVKVLILGKLPPPWYGPAVATRILLSSRLNDYYALFHLCTNINKKIEELAAFRPAKLLQGLRIYARLLGILRQHKPALALVPISQSSAGFFKDSFYILISKWCGSRVLIHLRGSNFLNWIRGSGRLNQWYVRWVLKKADGAIVLGNNLRNLFADYFPPQRIFVVPNGADYELKPLVRTAQQPVRLLYLSNLQPSKGIGDFLLALVLLQKRQVLFSANVVGAWRDENTRDECMAIAAQHGLPVTFQPPASPENKFDFLQEADIFVFPPRMPEGHPWVIIEAMASGLPIIATDQGAISESVLQGINGFIVESNHPELLAEKAALLIEQSDVRLQMGQASRRLYLERFTEDKMINRLREAFNAILAMP